MNNGKGIAMPKGKVNGIPFELLDTAKQLGDNVLVLRTLEVLENTVVDNINWREKSYNSYLKRVEEVSIDWTGTFDKDSLIVHSPQIVDVEGEEEPNRRVLVNFAALIPLNQKRKELN